MLERHSLKPDVDAKIVALGGGSGLRLAALQGRSVDGVMLSMPQNKMAVDGLPGTGFYEGLG